MGDLTLKNEVVFQARKSSWRRKQYGSEVIPKHTS
nr:MAG TPA: hypothetical protein [Caudoviricetes sp.]